MPFEQPFPSLPSALTVLTSMITPALLISATGTFILSTSNRLGRVVERVRVISEKMDEMMMPAGAALEMMAERKMMLIEQLGTLSERANVLQRSLTMFYLASGAFIASSVVIGFAAVMPSMPGWPPVALGILGACFLFYASLMLIFEARLAMRNLRSETDFLNKLAILEGRKHSRPA